MFEVAFPLATGFILLAASAYAAMLYRASGNVAVLWLSMGLVFVALETFTEAYIAHAVATNPAIKFRPEYYFLDAVRGTFIVLWAMAEAGVLLAMAGVQDKWIALGMPVAYFVAGEVYTLVVNLFSKIPDPDHRILVSSAGRVLGVLVPISLLLGIYLILAIARPTGSRGAAAIGTAFILHAVTLPAYSFAKAMGPAALGLWYAVGGIIPAFLALWGFRLMFREQAAG